MKIKTEGGGGGEVIDRRRKGVLAGYNAPTRSLLSAQSNVKEKGRKKKACGQAKFTLTKVPSSEKNVTDRKGLRSRGGCGTSSLF